MSHSGSVRLARRLLAMALLVLTIVPHPSPAGAASMTVRVVGAIGLGDPFGSSVAALGDSYAFVGTSTGRTLDVVDQQRGTLRASLDLPGLTPFGIVPLNMDMSALTLSPDNRYLYVLNRLRQDVDVFDLTGAAVPRAIGMREDAGHALSLSLDGTVLAVVGTLGTTFLDTRRGTTLETISWASAVTWSSRALYLLDIQGANAAVGEFMGGHLKRSFKLPTGTSLTPKTGSLALSPDGGTLYVLWNGLHAISLASGRTTANLALPFVPAYTGLAIAPNGRQAMIWAPSFAAIHESPSTTPGYVVVTGGFVGGGIQPIALPSLRPVAADTSLRAIDTPHEVAYSGDSARAYVATDHTLAVVATGTLGTDREPNARVAIPGLATGPVVSCSSYDVAGTWSFTAAAYATFGAGTGPVTLAQSGTALSGTLQLSGTTFTLSGSVQGPVVRFSLTAPGQVSSDYSGTISGDEHSIVGSDGVMVGTARCGTPPVTSDGSGSGSGSGGSGSGSGGSGGDTAPCNAWSLSGNWSFTASPTSQIGQGTGQATFSQSGGALSGTMQFNGLAYTISGTVTGTDVSLTYSAPGQIATTDQGTLSADGKTLSAGQGTFQGAAACTGKG
ncbi:MAG TPA: hypothetical protein VNL35_16925 [Chloroflexota bacterium]|nr:hypothetical protein [Chloroflexota bacterium]